jgi:hypothetical protein
LHSDTQRYIKMSLEIKDIKIIVRNCFDLPAEIPTRCEGLIGSFIKETEYTAGHRSRTPSIGYASAIIEASERDLQIRATILKFLSQLKKNESVTMRQIKLNSTACLTTTKVVVDKLLKLNLITRVRLSYKGKSLYHYSVDKINKEDNEYVR